MISKQTVIPVISSMKGLEAFLLTPLKVCILQDLHINHVKDMIKIAHENNREVIVHIELIQGVSNDEFGAQYLCQQFKIDGLISSKPKIIEVAMKSKVLAILRIFMMDSKSLKRSLQIIDTLNPDVVEFLPALTYEIFPELLKNLHTEVWAGGLIKNATQIKAVLATGIKRVTVSNLDLAKANALMD